MGPLSYLVGLTIIKDSEIQAVHDEKNVPELNQDTVCGCRSTEYVLDSAWRLQLGDSVRQGH